MDSYFGCEFIDDGCYGKLYEVVNLAPWRKTHPEAIEIPVSLLLEKFIDPNYIASIVSRDREMISIVEKDIAQNGLRNPIELKYDNIGNVTVHDGNHRILIINALTAGKGKIPALIKESDGRIKTAGLKVSSILPELLAAWIKEQP
jgi:ferredoxin-fold anticodon binding domain-containing protein